MEDRQHLDQYFTTNVFPVLTPLAVDPARKLKLVSNLPYSVATAATQPAQPGNPLLKTFNPNVSAGLDLKYAITPALSLTATVNPDFGQDLKRGLVYGLDVLFGDKVDRSERPHRLSPRRLLGYGYGIASAPLPPATY